MTPKDNDLMSLAPSVDGKREVDTNVEVPVTTTQAAITDISDILQNDYARQAGGARLEGFSDDFSDIVDYILKITYWIWHEKKIELCKDYYSEDCVLHTMAGDIAGSQSVVDNTRATLESFPDRTLDGENVVWSVEDNPMQYHGINSLSYPTYYSSHLIVSRMTNEGVTEFGPASNIRARIRTIADCICNENRIVEEWLMRDNAFLVATLGFDVLEVAKKQAEKDVALATQGGGNAHLLDALQEERQRVVNNSLSGNYNVPDIPEKDPKSFVQALFSSVWMAKKIQKLSDFYDFRVSTHLPGGREYYGTLEYAEFLSEALEGLDDIRISIDHVACIPYLGDAVDVAVRWSLVAQHDAASKLLGDASGTPIYILGGSHFRIIRNRIREEWTVYDELALQRQVATQRLL